MIYSVMITVLIAFAVIGIFCGKALRLDKCRRRVKSYIVIPCTCSDRELELLVKGCWWDEVCAGQKLRKGHHHIVWRRRGFLRTGTAFGKAVRAGQVYAHGRAW